MEAFAQERRGWGEIAARGSGGRREKDAAPPLIDRNRVRIWKVEHVPRPYLRISSAQLAMCPKTYRHFIGRDFMQKAVEDKTKSLPPTLSSGIEISENKTTNTQVSFIMCWKRRKRLYVSKIVERPGVFETLELESNIEKNGSQTHHWCNESSLYASHGHFRPFLASFAHLRERSLVESRNFGGGSTYGIEGDERKSFNVFFVSEKSERGPGRRTNENAPSIWALVPKLRRRLRESSSFVHLSIVSPPNLTRNTRRVRTTEGEACEMPGGDVGRSRHAGTSTMYGESSDHSIWTYELRGMPQACKWDVGVGMPVQVSGVQSGVRSVPAHTADGVLRAYERTVAGCGAEHGGAVAGPQVHQWVKEAGHQRDKDERVECEQGAHMGGRDRDAVTETRASAGARSGVVAAVRHRQARAERIRAGDVCAGANEPGEASAGSGALQVTAGTLWGAVGTSTQWQHERDASEGALRCTWARYSGGGNRTTGTACEQGCIGRAERIRPREACADSGKGGGRERSWQGARWLEENCRPWKRVCGVVQQREWREAGAALEYNSDWSLRIWKEGLRCGAHETAGSACRVRGLLVMRRTVQSRNSLLERGLDAEMEAVGGPVAGHQQCGTSKNAAGGGGGGRRSGVTCVTAVMRTVLGCNGTVKMMV
ncbi:hypothetical protein B0H14DRAFT_3732798 [Mycena olivaceomarginata]|nr:hypothetical protein B0H14DRAFT_3732798 [Mycena olivaceomarginata]